MSDINLSINQDLVKPIIEAQIKAAVVNALGKQDELIKSAIEAVLQFKVDYQGKRSQYQSDNECDFIEWHIQDAIQSAIKESITEWVKENKEAIKKEFYATLKTKKGSNKMIQAFMDGMSGSLNHSIAMSVNFNYR